MLDFHDDITFTIESLCREWQRAKVWLVRFVCYKLANPLDELLNIFDGHLFATKYCVYIQNFI